MKNVKLFINMPRLIKQIQGDVIQETEDKITLISSVIGQFGNEDYINMGNFEAFLQNFTTVLESEILPNKINFGLANSSEFVEIELNITCQ